MPQMKKADLEAFVRRDWRAVEELKEDYWARKKGNLSPLEALRIGDDLRRHALMLKPDWPNDEDRQEDLRVHMRVAASLRLVKVT